MALFFNRGTVRHTSELDRILALPKRRQSATEFGASIADEMTEVLSKPNKCTDSVELPSGLCSVCKGPLRLRPIQAAALYDIGTLGGLFGPIPVGHGKTGISLLAPYVTDAKRPLLVLPASLVRKTRIDWETKYLPHWHVPSALQIVSYEILGRVQSANYLQQYQPDLIVFDECHRAKNPHAAVTRRLVRYLKSAPDTMVVALSGTIMRKSILDFWHILQWCLKDGAPLPSSSLEVQQWASALDDSLEEFERFEPGALRVFSGGSPNLPDIRKGFQERLVSTPGVIAVTESGDSLVDASLTVRALTYEVSKTTNEHFERLRRDMVTPDDWQLMQAVEVWAHARQMALGMYYKWEPRPPEPWRRARRDWNAFVRQTLVHSRTLDSELQVAQACDAGRLPSEALNRWRAIRDTFTPEVVPVWFDDSALNVCLDWMKEPGIVWTKHDLFAQRLSELSGCEYYGAKGLTQKGNFINDAASDKAAIVSIDANKEGRDLQMKWSRNLITAPPDNADIWQQLLGRTHRSGQPADEVTADVLLGCFEHVNAWRNALQTAELVRDTTGAESKLLLATIDWPSDEEIAGYSGHRWR